MSRASSPVAGSGFHSDFEIRPGVWFGEWLNEQVSENAYMERRDFFADRVRAVADRL